VGQSTINVASETGQVYLITSLVANRQAQEFAETLCIPSEALEYRDTLARPSGVEIR
jgi:hypothetical protein